MFLDEQESVMTGAEFKADRQRLRRRLAIGAFVLVVAVLVNGKSVPVLGNLGVAPNSGAMAAVHTQANDGIIHVEAGTNGQPYTLGQLFTEWDVHLSGNQIGSLTASNGKSLSAYVNGKNVAGNPAMIRLSERQEIAIVYGPISAQVKFPRSFNFDEGL